MDELKDKRTVSRLWRLGAFGNKLRSWATVGDVPACLRDQIQFGLRSLVPGGPFFGKLSYVDASFLFFQNFNDRGEPQHYVCESADDSLRVVQGELMRDVGGLYFRHSFEDMPLRDALLRTDGTVHTMTGYAVDVYLKSICTPLSWIEIQDNLELGGIVELTVFKECVGDRVGRNVIVWENRLF